MITDYFPHDLRMQKFLDRSSSQLLDSVSEELEIRSFFEVVDESILSHF